MQLEKIKEKYKEEIEFCKQTLNILDILTEPPANVEILYTRKLTLSVKDMAGLHTTRQYLKTCLGSWKDRQHNIFYSCGDMIASYEGISHPIDIWLQTRPEDFPKELQSDKCKVTEVMPSTERQYAYICETNIDENNI
jgi:hypothetical protein